MATRTQTGAVTADLANVVGLIGGKKTLSGSVVIDTVNVSGSIIEHGELPLIVASGEEYIDFFLNSDSSIVELELVEISHPAFSQVYYIVKNAVEGITVTLEDERVVDFIYYPLALDGSNVRDDLDYIIKIKVGDLGEIIPQELDNVASMSGFSTKPTVILRTYRSDDLSAPMFGPLLLEITEFSFTKEGAEFEAKAPLLNINQTGEAYKLDRFPALRGVL